MVGTLPPALKFNRREIWQLAFLAAALVAVRIASAAVVAQPGYTDAYYYALVAERLATGQGLTIDFLWSFVDAPRLESLPLPSHRFWMPLTSVAQAVGILAFGPLLGTFRGAQAAVVLLAAIIPVATYFAARTLSGTHRTALVAGALAGLGGAFAPAWVSLDSFVIAALLGTVYFLALGRAANGGVRTGLVLGVSVGLLFLTRAEGALFGLPLLFIRGRAAATAAAVALLIAAAWLARQYFLGAPDLLGRTVFLVNYEDFFAIDPDLSASNYLASWPVALTNKGAALAANAVTALFGFSLLLAPGLVKGVASWWRWREVRIFVALAIGVYLAQSLIWTLHSTRGSYFHSLAAFFPFGVALAVIGSQSLLRGRPTQQIAAVGALLGVALLSSVSVASWDTAFNGPYRNRVAAAALLPPGNLLAIDAAAWRWITGRAVVVTPSDGLVSSGCALAVYEPRFVVLERTHFSRYSVAYAAALPIGADTAGIRLLPYAQQCSR